MKYDSDCLSGVDLKVLGLVWIAYGNIAEAVLFQSSLLYRLVVLEIENNLPNWNIITSNDYIEQIHQPDMKFPLWRPQTGSSFAADIAPTGYHGTDRIANEISVLSIDLRTRGHKTTSG